MNDTIVKEYALDENDGYKKEGSLKIMRATINICKTEKSTNTQPTMQDTTPTQQYKTTQKGKKRQPAKGMNTTIRRIMRHRTERMQWTSVWMSTHLETWD